MIILQNLLCGLFTGFILGASLLYIYLVIELLRRI